MYDFAAAGSGKYTFEPMTTFLVHDATKMPTSELSMVEVMASPVEVEIYGDMATRELAISNKRAVDICTDSSKKSFIDARLVVHPTIIMVIAQRGVFSATLKERLLL